MRITTSLILCGFLAATAAATDQGPRESTPPTVEPRAPQTSEPTAVTPIPGPLPDDRGVPAVKPKAGSGEGEMTADERNRRIAQIEKQLERKLGAKRRKTLEEELRRLRLDQMVSPEPAAP